MHTLSNRHRKEAALLFILLTLSVGSAASVTKQLPSSLRVLEPIPRLPITQTKGVDDVGPAFKNATETALVKGKAILSQYSNVLQIAAIPTGFAVTFFGYFLLAPVLFLAGFVSGGGACFIAVNAALGDTTQAAAWIAIAAMMLGGAMLGFLALRALSIGMFAVGGALGFVLASALKTSLIANAYPKDPQLAFIIASVVFGLIFGTIALCLQKQMLIFATAYAGSCGAMFGIGHFAGHFPSVEDLDKVETGEVNGWVLFYIIATLGLGTVGMLFQLWLAKGRSMPSHAPHDRRRRRRRIRQVEPDEWSEDEWADDDYLERQPIPRRKYDQDRAPELPITVASNERTLKIEVSNPRQTSYATSAPETWADFKAADGYDEDSSAKESDHAYSTPLATDVFHRRQVVEQASPDVEYGSEREQPFKKSLFEISPKTQDMSSEVPHTAIAFDVEDLGRKEGVQSPGNLPSMANGDSIVPAVHLPCPPSPGLVGISLESDNEARKAV